MNSGGFEDFDRLNFAYLSTENTALSHNILVFFLLDRCSGGWRLMWVIQRMSLRNIVWYFILVWLDQHVSLASRSGGLQPAGKANYQQ